MTTSETTVSPGLPGKFTSYVEKRARPLPTCEFVSRGSVMLRAALNERLQNKATSSHNNDLRKKKQVPHVDMDHRKRSSRNVVLFTEPLVTNQFEYEQTTLLDSDRQQDEDLGDNRVEKFRTGRKSFGVRKFKHAAKAFKHKPFRKRTDEIVDDDQDDDDDDDDDEDDIFIMASSTFPEISKKNPNKRPYCEDEEDQNSSIDSNQDSLFSSPKVAKIAPYYHDQYDASSDLKITASKQNRQPESQQNRTKNSLPVTVPRQGYMDWLSNGCISVQNYLSNQMNKLIF